MREFWLILSVVLTGTLWRISGQWEWTVPISVERKIIDWKRKWCWRQIIIRVISNSPIEDVEQFAWSLKSSLPKLQRELGVPVRLEIEWKDPETVAVLAECGSSDDSDHVQEIQNDSNGVQEISLINVEERTMDKEVYFFCLKRRFPELFWVEQAVCE